jgi:hypothetical protein
MVVAGWMNAWMAFFVRFAPRPVVLNLVKAVQEAKT